MKTLMSYVLCHSGKSWMDKVEQIRDDLTKKNVFAVVVAALDEVACELLMTWFFINMLMNQPCSL